MNRRWRVTGLAAALLAPSLAVLCAFVLYPLGRSIWLGHQRCDATGNNCRSNGWDQYIDVFRSREFQQAFDGDTLRDFKHPVCGDAEHYGKHNGKRYAGFHSGVMNSTSAGWCLP